MATSKIKGLDEPTLEGGIGGGGGMGRGSSSKLDNVFGIEGKTLRAKRFEKELEAMTPKQREALENPGKQFEKPKQEIKEVPMDIKGAVEAADKYHAYHYGKKTGGAVTASRRADGIAMRGKTRGKMC
jgi:hypothetical protein